MTFQDTNIAPEISAAEEVERRRARAQNILREVRKENISQPRTGPTFTIAQAAELVGRSASAIRLAEAEGRLPGQSRNVHGRRENYTLKQLNDMREVFGTRPWRHPNDAPVILPVQNFKGGVGKSTISLHLAQSLAMKGYRVLLIDADAQASSTMMFGHIPDDDIEYDATLYACLRPGHQDHRPIADLIRHTHFDGLDLIPANLYLYNAEYELAARMAQKPENGGGPAVLMFLKKEIATISDRYDVIILDPPPALGMISLSVLNASTSLIVPLPPNLVDFASTASFFTMLKNTLDDFAKRGIIIKWDFIQMVISRSDPKSAHESILALVRAAFGGTVMATEIKASAEIDNCTGSQQSVYDMRESVTNHAVRKRCLKQLGSFSDEAEGFIRKTWKNTPELER